MSIDCVLNCVLLSHTSRIRVMYLTMHAYTEALYGHAPKSFLPAYIVLFPYELLRFDRLLELGVLMAVWQCCTFSICLTVRDGLI